MDEIKHFGAPVAHVSDDRELDMARLGRVREEHMRADASRRPCPHEDGHGTLRVRMAPIVLVGALVLALQVAWEPFRSVLRL